MKAAPLPFATASAAVPPELRARLAWRADGAAAARADFKTWRDAAARPHFVGVAPAANACAALDDALPALGDEQTLTAACEDLAALHRERLSGFALGGGLDQLRGALALRLGRVVEAERWYRTGADWADAEGCPIELGRNLAGLAEVAERYRRRADAVRDLDQAAALFEQCGAKLWEDRARARLDELRGAESRDRPRYPAGLSAREIDVLRLIAEGRTNPEIAEALVIASGTVARHVTNILRKTGTANRAEAASYATKHRLLG